MSILSRDTTLFHPTEGKRTFFRGDQHPGAAWSDDPGGQLAAKADKELVAKLNASMERETALEGERDALKAQLDGQAKAHADALGEIDAKHADELKGRDDKIAALEADVQTAVEQRDAAAREARELAATLETHKDDRETIRAQAARIGELEAQIAKFDPDGDGKPGGGKKKAAE